MMVRLFRCEEINTGMRALLAVDPNNPADVFCNESVVRMILLRLLISNPSLILGEITLRGFGAFSIFLWVLSGSLFLGVQLTEQGIVNVEGPERNEAGQENLPGGLPEFPSLFHADTQRTEYK